MFPPVNTSLLQTVQFPKQQPNKTNVGLLSHRESNKAVKKVKILDKLHFTVYLRKATGISKVLIQILIYSVFFAMIKASKFIFSLSRSVIPILPKKHPIQPIQADFSNPEIHHY